jgi:hypothetical protein
VVIASEQELGRLPRFRIPESNGPIFTAGGQSLTIWCENGGTDIMCVASQRSEQAPGFNIPDTHEAIDAAAGER